MLLATIPLYQRYFKKTSFERDPSEMTEISEKHYTEILAELNKEASNHGHPLINWMFFSSLIGIMIASFTVRFFVEMSEEVYDIVRICTYVVEGVLGVGWYMYVRRSSQNLVNKLGDLVYVLQESYAEQLYSFEFDAYGTNSSYPEVNIYKMVVPSYAQAVDMNAPLPVYQA